ncbi:MAG: hypothetical protein ACRYFK_15910 [Janthinobacterium lividum]
MRPDLERLHLIEQQLLQGPAALSAADWRLRQLLDADLAADAQVQQHLYQGLRLAGRQQLRHELQRLHERLYAPQATGWLSWLRRWWAR